MSIATIEGLYVGYFGRAADPAGLNYWLGQEATLTDTQIATSFAVQTETTNLYPSLLTPTLLDASPAAEANFINAIYVDLFGHAADTAGLSFWQGQLTAGVSPGIMISSIISGAQGTDATAFSSKVGVATSYTNAVLTASPAVTWSAKNDTAQSKSILATVTSPATASATGASISAAITADQSGNTGTAGVTLTLTGGPDTFSPTAAAGFQTSNNNDTIRGIKGGLAPTTAGASELTSFDFIQDGTGANVMNAELDNEATVAPTIQKIGTINVAPDLAAQTLSGTSITGETLINLAGGLFGATGGDAAGNVLTVSGVSTAISLGMSNATGFVENLFGTFTGLAALGNSSTLVLNGNVGGTFDTNLVSGNGVNTYNIQSTGKANTVTIGNVDTQLTTLNISGGSALTLNTASPNVTTINGAAATGALAITDTAAVKMTVTGGSGANTITVTNEAKGSTLVGGSTGKDTLNFNGAIAGAAALTLTGGGAGAGDTIQTQAGGLAFLTAGDATSAGTLTTDVEVVTDYTAASTTIDIKGGPIAVLSGTQLAAVAGSSSLLTATQLAAKDTGALGLTAFAFGANEYVLQTNTAAGALSAGDGLMQLTNATATFKNSDLVNT